MTADPFTAATPGWQRAASRGVRLGVLERTPPVWPRGTWRGHLLAVGFGLGLAILGLAVFG